MLHVKVTPEGTHAEFEPASRLNVTNSGDVKAEFMDMIKGEHGRLELDLANLDYIDSSGVGALLSLLRQCKEREWKLTLRNPQPGVKELFNLLQLYSIFDFE